MRILISVMCAQNLFKGVGERISVTFKHPRQIRSLLLALFGKKILIEIIRGKPVKIKCGLDHQVQIIVIISVGNR